jgi:hypothetical protein
MGKKSRAEIKNRSRRSFLQTVSAGVPTLMWVGQSSPAAAESPLASGDEGAPGKFAPIDLSPYFNASSNDFGPRVWARGLGGPAAKDGVIRTFAGKQVVRGIPFQCGPGGVEEKTWVVLSARVGVGVRTVEIPFSQRVRFLCVAAFSDVNENEASPPGKTVIDKVGQHLADVVLVYEDGGEQVIPIRRRFEVDSPVAGDVNFASLLPGLQFVPVSLEDPLSSAAQWAFLQTGVANIPWHPGPPRGGQTVPIWISTLANLSPQRTVKILRLQAASEAPLVVCSLTAFHGEEDPLRYERLALFRLTLPAAAAEEEGRWKVAVDLGTIARTFVLSDFDPQAWLTTPRRGLGETEQPARGARYLYVELTASREATVTLRDAKTGKAYEFDLSQVVPGRELEARQGGGRIEILEAEKVWLHGRVVDPASGRPTPVRLSFRSKEGRYIPPYGHRTEINNCLLQDYGADLKLIDTSFAYVDGTFQVELPVGEVYLEMTKGFEHEAIRRKLEIKPGQRELVVEIPRFADLRSKGWVTADTHVHFLSPTTAILEGQAEGLNLINLLATQWGAMYTNVGDFNHNPHMSRDGETLVWVGTENRQHMLGHVSLLGGRGEPVYPMAADGTLDGYWGDPLWSSIAEWADACREREGVVISPHFPNPPVEMAADMVMGKFDAVELNPSPGDSYSGSNFREWYRYLNCGYRVTVAGGTDKMGAYMPAGANRTYAYLGQDEFNFANWAKAVRKGNTFETTGPLLLFTADGHVPGDDIVLGAGGGMVEVQAEAKCFVPIHRLEVVLNGRVVASREEKTGARELVLKEKVEVSGPAWLAARCISRLDPTARWPTNFLPVPTFLLSISAHTSPVYVRIPGQELFDEPVATYLLTLIEGAEVWLEKLAIRPDRERFERVRSVFRQARERLHRRLHGHAAADDQRSPKR